MESWQGKGFAEATRHVDKTGSPSDLCSYFGGQWVEKMPELHWGLRRECLARTNNAAENAVKYVRIDGGGTVGVRAEQFAGNVASSASALTGHF